MGRAQSKSLRLSQELSSIFTWTWETRLSQMRGGENMVWGPISRMFSWTVSGSSGKFTVKPTSRPQETDIICSPIQARGRKLTKSSVGCMGSTSMRLRAMLIRLLWVSMASLGLPVVPEVVLRMARSLALPRATASWNQPGCACSNSRPRASTSGKCMRAGWS